MINNFSKIAILIAVTLSLQPSLYAQAKQDTMSHSRIPALHSSRSLFIRKLISMQVPIGCTKHCSTPNNSPSSQRNQASSPLCRPR